MNKTPNDPPAQKEKREREQKEIWKQQERERERGPQDEPTEILPIPDIPKPGVDPRSWPEKDSKT
jgi:hypothetical protein